MFRKVTLVLFILTGCLWFVSCGGAASNSATTKPAQGTTPNLALGKEAVASSFEPANQYNGGVDSVAKFAVDGDMTTRWSSDYNHDANPNDAWIYVNLGAKTAFQTINITWEPAMASVYNIETSDDAKTWTIVTNITGNASARNTLKFDPPITAQYVKVHGIARKTAYGYSIWELKIFAQ